MSSEKIHFFLTLTFNIAYLFITSKILQIKTTRLSAGLLHYIILAKVPLASRGSINGYRSAFTYAKFLYKGKLKPPSNFRDPLL